MPSFINLIDEIQEWHSAYNNTQDETLGIGVTAHLINQKRARIINEEYRRHSQLNPQWFQDVGLYASSKVNLSNELSQIPGLDHIDLAMIKIPSLVAIDNERQRINDIGIVDMRSPCGLFYEATTRRKLITMAKTGDNRAKLPLYFREGQNVFCSPFRENINPVLILHDPRDGYIVNPGDVINGELIFGESYVVESGTISYNTGGGIIVLQRGQSFEANSLGGISWTGNGKVRFTNKRRKFRYTDEYPIDGSTWKHIKDLIIDDLMRSKGNMSDAVHDGASEEALQKSRE